MPSPDPAFLVSVDAIGLTAATAKTVLALATSATSTAIPVEWWVEFDGTTATNTPVKVEFGRFSAGVTTASSITPSKLNYGGNSIASQATVKHSATVEGAGTASDVEIHRVSPTSGLYIQYPLGREMSLGASQFLRIRVTAAQVVNCTFGIKWEE